MTQTLCDDRLSFMPLYMTDSVRNNIWLPPAPSTGKQLQRISSFGMSILHGTVDNTTLSKLIFTTKKYYTTYHSHLVFSHIQQIQYGCLAERSKAPDSS